MKKLFFNLLALVLTALTANAGTWTFEWETSASSDPNRGKETSLGFYNFSTSLDASLTSQTRNLTSGTDTRAWTIDVSSLPGCTLAYTATSGQSVGKAGAAPKSFTLKSSAFDGKIKSVTVSSRMDGTNAVVGVKVGGNVYTLADGSAQGAISTTASKAIEHKFTGDASGEIEILFSHETSTKLYYLRSISIEWEESAAAYPAPTFTPAPGTYDTAQSVTIAGTEGCDIFYTTDGNSPITSSTAVKYTGAITVDATATIKAVCYKDSVYGAVATGAYIIRRNPELSFAAQELTVEFPDDATSPLLNNPYKLPVSYVSADRSVAMVSSTGVITTMQVGETTITAKFAGNATYYPAEATYALHVVAKPKMDAPTMNPASGGEFDEQVEVTFTATDERAKALWYVISDTQPEVDQYGTLVEPFEINASPTMTKTFTENTTIWIQAVGDNVWSEVVKGTFKVNQALAAKFSAAQTEQVAAVWHFDSEAELADWSTTKGSRWTMTDKAYSNSVAAFKSINPDSKYSLYYPYTRDEVSDAAYTPVTTIPAEGKARFWTVFNPVWLYNANLQLYVVEDGNKNTLVWDAYRESIKEATDDSNWKQYTVDLSAFAGKSVELAFVYSGADGDDVMIDDLEILSANNADDATATITAGQAVDFKDLSRGYPVAWSWSLPGAAVETSTEQNPSVVYPSAGSYDVTLTVTDAAGKTATLTRKNFVNVRGVAPKAIIGIPEGAYYSPEAALVVPVGVNLTFTDLSTGNPESRVWKIQGANIATSTDKEVTFAYTTPGTYDLDLTVKNAAGESTTYLYQIKAGTEANAWNIAAAENSELGTLSLGWYGYYGGTNWLDMPAFGEKFAKPLAPAEIASVNVFFGKATVSAASADSPITVAITKVGDDGKPGDVIASASLKASELIDASQTYNDPTTFTFATPASVNEPYFVTIAGFPNQDGDDVAMYLCRRSMGAFNSAYHQLDELDASYQPTGVRTWEANTDEGISFAIAPRIKYTDGTSAITLPEADIDPAAPALYYTLQGILVPAERLTPGIYIERRGSASRKILVK